MLYWLENTKNLVFWLDYSTKFVYFLQNMDLSLKITTPFTQAYDKIILLTDNRRRKEVMSNIE